MKKFRRNGAFTLLEMLVVISIITMLATMILVSFAKFKAKAREMQCKNNLKDLHGCFAVNHANWISSTAVINLSGYYRKYQSDNKYHWQKGWVDRINMPEIRDNATSWDAVGTPTPWRGEDAYKAITNGTLYQQAEPDPKIYLCPVFEMIANTIDGSSETMYRSYAANHHINLKSYKGLASDGKGLSRYLMFADMAITNRSGGADFAYRACFSGAAFDPNKDNGKGGDGQLEGGAYQNVGAEFVYETIGDYHASGKANGIFMDGHIESLERDNIYNICTGNL